MKAIRFTWRLAATILIFGALIAIGDIALAGPPKIYLDDGQYLGTLSNNRFDPESTSNRYGEYGNRYGDTINNRFREHGSRYSPDSHNNRFAPSGRSRDW